MCYGIVYIHIYRERERGRDICRERERKRVMFRSSPMSGRMAMTLPAALPRIDK